MIGKWTPVEYPSVPGLNAKVTTTETADILFIGDLHLDNPKSDRNAIKRALTEAVNRDAAIVLLGDVFDAMQGVNDRRGSKRDLMAKYVGREDYVSALVEDVAEFLVPFAKNIWVVLQGNHESAIAKHYGVHLENLLAYELNKAGGSVVTPGYQTYGMLGFIMRNNTAKVKTDARVPFWMSHGSGGGGPVTKGTIQAQRRAVTYPDARFVVSGHIHSSYFVSHEQHRLSKGGIVFDTEQEHYVVGAWKNEHTPKQGWWVEKGMGPRLPSAWMASFRMANGRKPGGSASGADRIAWEFTRMTY